MEFNRPTNIIPAPWAENGQYETIPATQVSSGRASWDTGFPPENTIPVSSGGIPANYNDFQGVLHDLSEHTCFQQTGGLYLWSSSIDYPVGAVVQGSDNGIYRALAKNGPNTTVANPVTDSSGKWTSFVMTNGNQTISGGLTVTSGISGTASDASSLGGIAASGYVTTSGAQTITGAKTFSSPIYIPTTSGAATDAIFTTTDNGAVHICGGSTSQKGAFISLCGKDLPSDEGSFYLCAKDGVNTQKNLRGQADGTLTWNNKGFVYDSTAQDITGIKTFVSPANTNSLVIKGTGITYNVKPSSTQAHGVIKFVSNDDYETAIVDVVRWNTGIQYLQILLDCYNGQTAKGVRVVADGTIATPAWVIEPSENGTILLGQSARRWKEIWCTQNSINTSSDERIKQQINTIPDAVLDAWGDVSWIQFKFNDAVKEKGAENARLHNGLIAQRVSDAFSAHGLDVSQYGLFLYDEWQSREAQKDENGKVILEAQEAGDAYGLRYTEALCMEAAYQRRRADRAEARISALEQRLGELEAVLASLISPISEEQTAEPEEPVVEETPEQEGEGAE